MAGSNRLGVLLADDDGNDLFLIRRAFKSLGNSTLLTTVPDGEEAIAYLLGDGKYADRGRYPFPDVLVLDHRMPRLSGLGVLCWLRDDPRFAALPVLVFSLTLLPSEMEIITRLRAVSCAKPMDDTGTSLALWEGIQQAFAAVGEPLPDLAAEELPVAT